MYSGYHDVMHCHVQVCTCHHYYAFVVLFRPLASFLRCSSQRTAARRRSNLLTLNHFMRWLVLVYTSWGESFLDSSFRPFVRSSRCECSRTCLDHGCPFQHQWFGRCLCYLYQLLSRRSSYDEHISSSVVRRLWELSPRLLTQAK